MGFCTRRYFFLSICLLQILAVVQKQVFDFLGFLWIPILFNFFEIIFIIFGFFGAYHYRPKYVIAYLLWHIFWLAWNIFAICLYLDLAGLDHKTNKVLKLDSSDSWWKSNGPGCIIPPPPEDLSLPEAKDCWFDYQYVEIFQAGVQCFLTFLGCIIGTCLNQLYMEEDDTFNFEKADGTDNYLLHPMYVKARNNQQKSNVNVKPDVSDFSENVYFNSFKKSNFRADAIRIPEYNNDYKPKSLGAEAQYYD